MKKKIFTKILTVLFGAAFFITAFSCKSVPYLEDNSPVVILSVISNPRTPWDAETVQPMRNDDDDYDEEGTGLLTNLVGKLISKNNLEILSAQDRVDYAAEALTDLFTVTGGVEVIPHEELLESKTYKSLGVNFLNYLETTQVATGYVNNMQLGPKHARMIMEETGAKGMVMADFTFQKTIVRGTTYNGSMAAKAKLKIRFLNAEGKEIISNEYVSISPETINVIKRKYDQQAFVDLFQPTTDAVINQFLVNHIK